MPFLLASEMTHTSLAEENMPVSLKIDSVLMRIRSRQLMSNLAASTGIAAPTLA
jgi:hypothetical protein